MKVSAVHAKSHFSELVAAAEHKGTVIEIQKHGKTAAILGPTSLLEKQKKPKRRAMTPEEIAAFWATVDQARAEGERNGTIDPNVSAVEDLIASRR